MSHAPAAERVQATGLALCALLLAMAARADTLAPDSAALAAALRNGCPAARLQPMPAVQGCGPAGCGTRLGPLFVDADAGSLRRGTGQPLPVVVDGPVAAADLPELNWTPLRGYTVRQGRVAWGQCLEFAHASLGSSGRGQRWRSVLLVANGGHSAQRIAGYQAGCAALCAGPGASQVQLPAVEPVQLGQPALQIAWHRCTAQGCERQADDRAVDGRADSESGLLTLRP
jgi:hypothetical protein